MIPIKTQPVRLFLRGLMTSCHVIACFALTAERRAGAECAGLGRPTAGEPGEGGVREEVAGCHAEHQGTPVSLRSGHAVASKQCSAFL